MKFGIFDHLDKRDEPLGQFYEERLQLAKAAEAAGFYTYQIAEHHGTPLGVAPSPNLFLAAMSRETKTLRFGPAVYLLPLYPPVRLIEEVCMIDNLSGGRLDMGGGRGTPPDEVGSYNIDYKNGRAMFEEALEILLKGLTSPRLDHHGKWYTVPDMPMVLQPVQKPYPPLWYGSSNVDSARFAARYGMHFTTFGTNERVKPLIAQYSQFWEETKNEPWRKDSPVKQPLIGLGRHFVIADTDAAAERLGRQTYAYWWNSVSALWREHNAAPVTGMLIPTYDEAHRAGQIIAGTPERVRNEIVAQAKDMKFNYLLCQIAFGNLTHSQEMNSLRLFADQVMPALAKL